MSAFLRAFIASLILAAGIVAGVSVPSHAGAPAKPFWTTRPCASEGDNNCYWNAGTSGNGAGHSYIVRAVPGSAHMVCVFYVERAYARTHDYCA